VNMNPLSNLVISLPVFFWLTLSAAFFAVGEYLSKKFAIHPDSKGLLLVCVAYLLGTLAWLPAIVRTNQLASTGTAWLLLSMIATLGIGLGVFHEKLNSFQVVGVALAAGALILLNHGNP
jgi:drug/metabolite transporter (DMT)-like permease